MNLIAGAYLTLAQVGATQAGEGPKRGPNGLLGKVQTWDYVINKATPSRLSSVPSDLLVMDYSRWGNEFTRFSPRLIEGLKRRADGKRRLVLAYMSVGEAEDYRFYWRWSWHLLPPSYVLAENCRWPGNHPVRYWDPDWQAILFRGTNSYLERIQRAGFDGIYLDRVDVFQEFEKKSALHKDNARNLMIEMVEALAKTARAKKPDFLIIAQNAEELLSSPRYLKLIDGVAKEDLLYGLNGTGVRNAASDIAYSEGQLDRARKAGKSVLTVEYLQSAELERQARAELTARGYRPVFPPRRLDGSDPLTPKPTKASAGPQAGTPEYGRAVCAN